MSDNTNSHGMPVCAGHYTAIKPKPKKKPRVEVCPICWRANCRLFVRLNGLTFSPADKTRFFREFHRDVCKECKKLSCPGTYISKCEPRAFDHKRKVLPTWFQTAN